MTSFPLTKSICVHLQMFSQSKVVFSAPLAHLNWSFQLRFLVAQPHHAKDRHGNAKPIKEAEEVDDREYVIGESVEESHDTLWGESKEKVV